MKKKLSTLTVVALFVLPISLPVAHSATKAGAKCTKVGVKSVVGNKTLTCIKSGKKLVWNKGVVTPTVEPVVTSKVEPFVAWSTKFQINSLIKSAIDSTNSYVGVVRPDNSYEIAIQNSVRESDRKWITGMLDYTNGFFQKLNVKN
jgi:hypothetical protein